MSDCPLYQNGYFKNWVKCCMGLRYLHDGLYEYVDKTVRDQHQSLVLMVEQKLKTEYNCCECSIVNLLPNHDRTKCTQKKSKQSCNCIKPDGKRKCPQNGACGYLLELTIARHFSNLPNLKNCDLRQWRQNHWEYAKCFSNGTGLLSNGAAITTDAAGLISICLNNTDIRKQFSAEDSLEKMIKSRNRLLHSSKLEVGDKELDDVFDLIKTILCNMVLAYEENAKASLKTIEQLLSDKLLLSSEDRVVGSEMALIAIAERKDEIEETLKDFEGGEDLPKSDSEDTANLNTEMDLHKELADLKVVETKHYASIESYIKQTEKELKIHKEYLEILKSRAAKTNALLETMVEKLDEQGKTLKDIQKDMSKVTNQLDVFCGREAELNKIPLDIRVVALVKKGDKNQEETIFKCFVEVQNRRMGEHIINNNELPTSVTAALTRSIHELEGDSRDIEDIQHECIAMYIHCDSLQSLVGLINQYMSGELVAHFHPFVFELQQQPGYENVDLEVVIFEKDFVQCLDKFLRKVKRRIGSITYDEVKSLFEEYASSATLDADENTEMNIACGYEDQAALSETTDEPKSEDEFECDESQISDGSDLSVEMRSGDDNVETEEKCSLEMEKKWLNTDENKKGLSSDDECVSQVSQIHNQERKELKAKDDANDIANDTLFDNLPQSVASKCGDTMQQPVTSSEDSVLNTVPHEHSCVSIKQIIAIGMDMNEQSKHELREEHHTRNAEISNDACDIKDDTVNCSKNVGKKLLLQTMVKDIGNEKQCTTNNEAYTLRETMVMHVFDKKHGEYINNYTSSNELDNPSTVYIDNNVCCISHENYPMLQAAVTLDKTSEKQKDSEIITETLHYEKINIFENTSAQNNKNDYCSTDVTSCSEQAAVKEEDNTVEEEEKEEEEEEEEEEEDDYDDKLTDDIEETYQISKEVEQEDEDTGRDFDLYHNDESTTKNQIIITNSTTDKLYDDEEMEDPNEVFDGTKRAYITPERSHLGRNIYPSFEEQSDEEEWANFNESKGFPDNITCCQVTLEQELEQLASGKKYEATWDFQINSLIPLIAVSLMESATAENFNISEITDDNKAVPGIPSMCQKWTMPEQPGDGIYKYSVKVHFNSLCYGEFQQTVKFDFGSAVEQKTMRVTMKPIENIEEIKLEYLTYHGTQWSADCCDIIPFIPNILSIDEEELLDKYPLISLSTDDYATEVSGELTRDNYRLAMHKLLYAEEYDRQQRIAEFNIDTSLTHASDSTDVTSFEGRVQGHDELCGNIKLNDDFKTDTLAAQLIFRDTNCVLIRPSTEGTQRKVYEAIILKRQQDSIVVQLTDAFVNDVGFSNKHELPIQVQMQLNRSYLCKMHNAIDKLGGLHLVLPDKFPKLELAEAPMSPIDDDLAKCNKNQRDAILKAAVTGVRKAPPLLIVGPFGTGKTFTIAQATKYIIHKESTTRVLICTHSNSEADIYIKEYFDPYVKTGHEEARPLRVLYQHRWTHTVSEDVKPYCLLKEDVQFPYFRHPTMDDIKTRRIVVTTMGTADVLTHVVKKGFFTHIFLDEAAQVLETELLVPLSMAGPETRVILAGDYMQMSPVLYSKACRRRAFHTSLIERLNTCYPKDSLYKIILCDNYRSNAVIVDFTSAFYDYPLRAVTNPPPHNELHPLAFFSVRGEEVLYKENVKSGYYNKDEVREVVEQVQYLKHCWPKKWNAFSERHICVVAPYQIQIMYIRQELRKKQLSSVSVERIENVQGKQFRVIIISTVRTKVPENEKDEGLDLGFFSNIRLCNTAITRAESQVITIGDPFVLCGYGHCRDFWKQYIHECHHSNSFFGIEWGRFQFKRNIYTHSKLPQPAFPFPERQRRANQDIDATVANSDKHSSEVKDVKLSNVKAEYRADQNFVQSQESYHQIQSVKDDYKQKNVISWQNISMPESNNQRDDRASLNNQENVFNSLSNQNDFIITHGQPMFLGDFSHQKTSSSDFNQQNIVPSNVHQTQSSSTGITYTQASFPGSSHSEMGVDFPPLPFSQQYNNASPCGYPAAPIDAEYYQRFLNVPQNLPQNDNTRSLYRTDTEMRYLPRNAPLQANAFDSSYQPNMNSNWTRNSYSFQDPNLQTKHWVPSATPSLGYYGNDANSYWPCGNISDNQHRFMYPGNNQLYQHSHFSQPVGNPGLNFSAMPDLTRNSFPPMPAPSTFIPLRFPVPPISTTVKGQQFQQPANFQPLLQPPSANQGTVLNALTAIVGQKKELGQTLDTRIVKKDECQSESREPITTTPDRERLQAPKLEQGVGFGSSRTPAHKNETESHEKSVNMTVVEMKSNTEAKEAVQTQEQCDNIILKKLDITFGSFEGIDKHTAKHNTCTAKCKEYKVTMPRLGGTHKTTLKERTTPINDEMRFKTKQKCLKDMSLKSEQCNKNAINDQKEEKHDEKEPMAEPGNIKSYSEAVKKIIGEHERHLKSYVTMNLNDERFVTSVLPKKQDEGLTDELCGSEKLTASKHEFVNESGKWVLVHPKKYPRLSPNGKSYYSTNLNDERFVTSVQVQEHHKKYPRLSPNGKQNSPPAESESEQQDRLWPLLCTLNPSSRKTSKPPMLATIVQKQGSSKAPLSEKPKYPSNIFVRKREAVTLGAYFPKSGNYTKTF